MSSDSHVDDHALKEAWRWLERLDSRTVSTAAIMEFFDWRALPGNDAAYRKAERLHKQSGAAAQSSIVQQTLADIDDKASERASSERATPIGRFLIGPASMAALALAFFAASLMPNGKTYETALGERKVVTLPDGSSVTLDTGSQLRVRFSKGARDVALIHGQALFNVVHKPDQPFRVVAGKTTITDLGTRFDVREDAGSVKVTVMSGSAEVATAGTTSPAWILHPGQQISTDKPTALPHPVDAAAAVSWTGGHLVFDKTPLNAAVAEINRYGRVKVVLVGASLSALPISGAFDTGDTYGFAAGVAKLHDLTVSHSPDGSITLTRVDATHST